MSGLTVAAGQLPKLLGIPGDPTADNFIEDVRVVIEQFDQLSVTTVVFSAGTIAVLLGVHRFAPAIPGPLVAVVGGILLVLLGDLDEHGVDLIAEVPSGLPTPVAVVRPRRGPAPRRVRDRDHVLSRDGGRRPSTAPRR